MVLLGLGLSAAVILAAASKFLYVKEDPRIEKVKAILPGANCGGCGYPGCAGAAAAVVAGTAPADVCVAGGHETAQKVADIMGAELTYREPRVAEVRCTGGRRAADLYIYEGAHDCRAAAMLYGGGKQCALGCLGLGSCTTVCPFDAIHMGADNLPHVNPEKCKACGRCAEVCPGGIISIVGMTARLLHFNATSDCLAPCRQKCPAEINVPLYIHQIRKGDLVAALLTIKERNPLPAVCGRVCLHPCENSCRRNTADHGVAINRLQRYLSEWEMNSGARVPILCAPDSGHKIAVVGGGPAGLSCAYFLRRLGHHPVIFEAMAQLGGMLRYGIPEYRLPKQVVDWEMGSILELGVEARMQVKFGRDFDLSSLEAEGFEAVFLGIGAWTTPPLGVPGENVRGVIGSIDFLDHVGTTITTLKGRRVVVVGESNTAMDTARSSIRLGAKSVTVICPCIRKEMSANKRDIDRAMEEGIQILFLTVPRRVVSNEAGMVTHLEYIRMETNNEGKGQVVTVPNSETLIDTDLLVAALERKPDLSCIYDKENNCRFEITRDQTLAADEDTLQTAVPHVFTAGDMHTGRASVIKAIGGGRRAARSIHYYITEGRIPVPENLQRKVIPESILRHVEAPEYIPRVRIQEVPVEVRRHSFTEEVKGSITDVQALLEANRCLRCGSICYDHKAAYDVEKNTPTPQITMTEFSLSP